MVIAHKPLTVEEFEAFCLLPENADKLFEFIAGEVVEVPSNPYSSKVGANILFYIKLHLHQRGSDDHVTGKAGGYWVFGERYAPDVAYLSKAKQFELVKSGYNPIPPDLTVEVMSPTDNLKELMMKVGNYLAAGTVIWVVYSEPIQIAVYVPGQPVKLLGINDVLDGGSVLPGFRLAVKDVFK